MLARVRLIAGYWSLCVILYQSVLSNWVKTDFATMVLGHFYYRSIATVLRGT